MKNSELNKYANTDFYHYALRKLSKRDAKYLNCQIEVALPTNKQFEEYKALTSTRWKNSPNDKYEMVLQSYTRETLAEMDASKNN